jgi:hypothetical protein
MRCGYTGDAVGKAVYAVKLLKRVVVLLLLLCLYPEGNTLADEEIYYADIPLLPSIQLLKPLPGEGYAQGNQLNVSAKGNNVSRIEVTLSWDGGSLTQAQEGDTFEYTFQLPVLSSGLHITARGFGKDMEGQSPTYADAVRDVPSPKEELIGKMIALAFANSKDSRYKFAPAEEDYDIGVCKNFVMRLFDTYSKDYVMQAYSDLPLHMPKNNSKAACAPYDYGIEWRPESAEDGTPFEIVAQFKYNNDLSKEENAQIAFDMLKQVQKGDFFQMVGNYGGGNGPHSLFFITDYDPVSDMLHWTDSNMKGTRVNGVRWGYLQYDADATAHWFIECINTKKRGATLYRLRDDLIRK